MAYELRPDKPIPEEIVRVMREQFERIARHLRSRQAVSTRIHETRKRMKETRALLRLIRPALGPQFEVENSWFSTATHAFAAARDAIAVIEAVEKLRKQTGDPAQKRRLGRVKRVLRTTAPDDLEARVATLLAQLPEAQARLEGWSPLRDRFRILGEGLEQIFHSGRRQLAAVHAHPSPEAFHDLRKRVKDHWYHVRLLRRIWPELMKPYAEVIEELSDALGDHHDLHVLQAAITAAPARFGTDRTVKPVLAAIEQRRDALQTQALRLATHVYAESPKAWRERMRTYWKVARG
jgi:CHAD domain-containing protein